MLYTTFTKLHDNNACTEGYKKLALSLGGVTKYGKDTPIPLDKIIESNGLADTIWSLRATTESAENILIEFACRCAEHVLHFYEDKYPDDKRPRLAIEATRVRITDKSPAAESAAWSAAWSAAESVAESAAESAARSAARSAAESAAESAWSAAESAEEKWQTEQLLELIRG